MDCFWESASGSKDNNFAKLDNNATFKVTNEHECNLGKWIDEVERKGESFTKTNNWKHLKEVHAKVHGGVQSIVNNNAQGNTTAMLNETLEIDKAISDVFWTIQEVKRENCQEYVAQSQRVISNQTAVAKLVVQKQNIATSIPKSTQKTPIKPIIASSDDDEWASF